MKCSFLHFLSTLADLYVMSVGHVLIYSSSGVNNKHFEQRKNWVEKNYLFEKIWVFDFSKLALVCTMKISGAWHALHAITETEWHHNIVVIATEGIVLWWPGNCIGGGVWYKFEGHSCYGNRTVHSFHFSNGMHCVPCSWDLHPAYQC